MLIVGEGAGELDGRAEEEPLLSVLPLPLVVSAAEADEDDDDDDKGASVPGSTGVNRLLRKCRFWSSSE